MLERTWTNYTTQAWHGTEKCDFYKLPWISLQCHSFWAVQSFKKNVRYHEQSPAPGNETGLLTIPVLCLDFAASCPDLRVLVLCWVVSWKRVHENLWMITRRQNTRFEANGAKFAKRTVLSLLDSQRSYTVLDTYGLNRWIVCVIWQNPPIVSSNQSGIGSVLRRTFRASMILRAAKVSQWYEQPFYSGLT